MIFPKKKGGRPTKKPSDAQLAIMYQTMTATEIGKEFDVSPNTVRNWIRKVRNEQKKLEEQGKAE